MEVLRRRGCHGAHRIYCPGPPIDFSFHGITRLSEIVSNEGVVDPLNAKENNALSFKHSESPHFPPANQTELHETARTAFGVQHSRGVALGPPSLLKVHNTVAHGLAEISKGQEPSAAADAATAGGSSFTPTRKSICITRKERSVSVCSLMLRSQQSPVIKEKKTQKMFISLVPTSIKLNNNELSDVLDLFFYVSKMMPSPSVNLQWLDLSFNKIAAIPSSLNELYNLKCLYLHCNVLANPADVLILQENGKLKSLTLMGNPIEEYLMGGYR